MDVKLVPRRRSNYPVQDMEWQRRQDKRTATTLVRAAKAFDDVAKAGFAPSPNKIRIYNAKGGTVHNPPSNTFIFNDGGMVRNPHRKTDIINIKKDIVKFAKPAETCRCGRDFKTAEAMTEHRRGFLVYCSKHRRCVTPRAAHVAASAHTEYPAEVYVKADVRFESDEGFSRHFHRERR